MRSYPVKENPISSAVSEILRYRQTDRHIDKHISFYFIIRILDFFIFSTILKKNINVYKKDPIYLIYATLISRMISEELL